MSYIKHILMASIKHIQMTDKYTRKTYLDKKYKTYLDDKCSKYVDVMYSITNSQLSSIKKLYGKKKHFKYSNVKYNK